MHNHAIARVDDTLQFVAVAKYFSTLNQKSGYWQMEVKESDKVKTVFQVDSLAFDECNRMTFGLCSAPATFQRACLISILESVSFILMTSSSFQLPLRSCWSDCKQSLHVCNIITLS